MWLMTSASTPTDAELLRESRRRPDAFVEVCSRHADALAAWLRRDVGANIAEELLAETLARAWLGRRRYRDPGDGSGGPWLFGIARNLVRDYRRRGAIDTRARRRLGLPTDADAYSDVDDRVSAEARFASVAPLLDELPPEQRAALELRVVDELDYGAIGARLEVNAVTARTRVHRALKTLRARAERSEG
jgi:RNA polymerase sigma-70 factor (ECF subfamily)